MENNRSLKQMLPGKIEPRLGAMSNQTRVELYFRDGRIWTGTIDAQDEKTITIKNENSNSNEPAESRTCSWTGLTALNVANEK